MKKRTRFLSVLLTLCLLGSVFSVGAGAIVFTLSDELLITSEINLTRAEAAIQIAEAYGLGSDATESSFSDVEADSEALTYIEACAEAGIINGYPDGTFRPDNNVTRAEMAKMLSIAQGLESGAATSSFSDVADSHWAFEAIEACVEAGLLTGYSDGTFLPDDGISASEASTIFAAVKSLNRSAEDLLTDADVVGNTYSYDEVNEAFGFTTTWTLTFSEDGTGSMFEPNVFFGDTIYTISWTYADGIFTVTLLESDSGSVSTLSDMFDSSFTGSFLVYSDGTFEPAVTYTSSTTTTGSSDADYPGVSYASNSDAQVMDIYLPENATGSDPVIVVVHGGGFKFGDQTMDIILPVIEAGVENGYVVASVDYRKSGEATFPAALSDVKAAVRYLRANAEIYGIDPDRVVIWGESAGAYLSLMTALTPDVEALNGDVTDNLDYASSVTALVDFYGPVEFYTMDAEYEALGIEGTSYSGESSFESAWLGQAIGLDESYTYTTWWGSYVDELPEGYTLSAWIQAGTSDTSVPYTQSQNFAAALAEVIGEENVTFGLIEGAEHEDDAFYTDENLAAIFEFLGGIV